MRESSVQFEKKRLIAVLSVLTFGLTVFSVVVSLNFLAPVIFVFGFFLVVPLVALLGDALPFVENESDGVRVEHSDELGDDPIEELRSRYARGELTDEEFERRLERLLETEELERHLEAERDRGARTDDRVFEYE